MVVQPGPENGEEGVLHRAVHASVSPGVQGRDQSERGDIMLGVEVLISAGWSHLQVAAGQPESWSAVSPRRPTRTFPCCAPAVQPSNGAAQAGRRWTDCNVHGLT